MKHIAIENDRDKAATGQAENKPMEIIVLGPVWRDHHPLTARLLCELKLWGWHLSRDSQGRIYAMCPASHTEGRG